MRCPRCKWQKGYFVGIAWKQNDPFTYRIWTEEKRNGWKIGKEIIRNVVRPSSESNSEEDRDHALEIADHDFDFKLNKNARNSSMDNSKRKNSTAKHDNQPPSKCAKHSNKVEKFEEAIVDAELERKIVSFARIRRPLIQ